MRMIDADKLEAQCKEIIAHEWNKKAAPVSWAHAYESFLDMLEIAPTITADDYFDAVDRIKPCPNCRYILLGALTEDVPQWIPVTERLPETVRHCVVLVKIMRNDDDLCYWTGVLPSIGYFSSEIGGWVTMHELDPVKNDVLYWCYLPEDPKENEDEKV